MYFKSFFGLSTILGLMVTAAYAKCPVAPDNWESKEYQTSVLWQSHADGIVALQGVLSVESPQGDLTFVTHGYADSNASIWSPDGSLRKTARLGEGSPASLIADVAFDGDHLWWTDYRNGVLFRTDTSLTNVASFTSEVWKTTLVGITYSSYLDAIIFPLRDKRPELIVADKADPSSFKVVKLKAREGRLRDLYDVASYENCLFIVSRGDGQIYVVPEEELISGGRVSMKLLLDDLKHPQHIAIQDEKIYLIETKGYRVLRFDFRDGTRSSMPVPGNRIFRGLTVDQDGAVVLSGFRDAADISEDRTALTKLVFD